MRRLVPFFCLLPILLSAQTLITGGNVSGVWDSTGSPYLVEGDICVPSGSTFVIEAGCTLKFLGYYELRVDSGATFKIKGTADAPVVVTANDSFRGIKLNYVSACTLEHMELSRGRRGITIENSEVVIKNSEIDSCKYCLGSGIWADRSDVEIDSCNFYDNIAHTAYYGVGWGCYGEGWYGLVACGGAAYFVNSGVTIIDSKFIRNKSKTYNCYEMYDADELSALGGAIRAKYSSITINNCIFRDNQAIGAHGMDCYYHYYPPGPGGDAKGGVKNENRRSSCQIRSQGKAKTVTCPEFSRMDSGCGWCHGSFFHTSRPYRRMEALYNYGRGYRQFDFHRYAHWSAIVRFRRGSSGKKDF